MLTFLSRLAWKQYSILNTALLYVPRYMLEHADFGYRETEFVVKVRGQGACLGTLLLAL